MINLEEKAHLIRADILRMAASSGGCHLAGPLSVTDLLVGLYFGEILRFDPKNPAWSDRDRFILSCGHYAPAWYAILARCGYFGPDELTNLRQIGSFLQGHPSRLHSNFVEVSTGSLGQGLSVGLGMALGLRLQPSQFKPVVWVLTSDAEYQEGQTWEAVMAAPKFKVGNLKVIVDANNIQIDGSVSEVMPLGNLAEKLADFNWSVLEIEGHDFNQILKAYRTALQITDRPVVIIAKTIAGKGVSFMEGKWQWHDGKLDDKQLEQALRELR